MSDGVNQDCAYTIQVLLELLVDDEKDGSMPNSTLISISSVPASS
jgi:hypothetical protein